MPELPDVEIYVNALRVRILRARIETLRIISPFLLRTYEPPVESVIGREVVEVSRLGKRIVIGLSDGLFIAIHLMIAGRLRWMKRGAKPPPKIALATIQFVGGAPAAPTGGTLLLTEASQKKRAALHVLPDRAAVSRMHAGGLEPLECSLEAFVSRLRSENHTLKRALTDPRLFSGIGNAFSDEILHAAGLSPVLWTSRISAEQAERLFKAMRDTLQHWVAELRGEFAGRFPGPGEITAFRPGFAVHGRFGEPCRRCATAVQRIRYAENETNYCPRCQTEGRILADRSLSRLLKDDWPRRVEEWEEREAGPH